MPWQFIFPIVNNKHAVIDGGGGMKTLLRLAKAETSKHYRSWLLHYPRSSPGVNGFC